MKATSKKISRNWPISRPEKFDIEQVCDNIATYGFSHIDGLQLPDELLQALHREVAQLDSSFALKAAGTGRGGEKDLRKTIRRDKIKWLDGNTLAQCQLQEKLEEFRLQINRRLILGLFEFESHYAVYRQGDFYKRHLDSFKGEKTACFQWLFT